MSTLKTIALSLALVFTATTGAFAIGPGDAHEGTNGYENGQGHENHQGNGWGHHKGGHEVPELDPNAAGGALILLVGGTLVLLERRRG
jgi:hypothetical protein